MILCKASSPALYTHATHRFSSAPHGGRSLETSSVHGTGRRVSRGPLWDRRACPSQTKVCVCTALSVFFLLLQDVHESLFCFSLSHVCVWWFFFFSPFVWSSQTKGGREQYGHNIRSKWVSRVHCGTGEMPFADEGFARGSVSLSPLFFFPFLPACPFCRVCHLGRDLYGDNM